MSTIIRRAPRKRRGPARLPVLLALIAAGGLLGYAWHRGGPQPVRVVAVALPDPVPAPGAQP